ncbi:MAG: EAL domain-containing protein [Solirubrobacteraceae bacterium]
MSSSAKSGAAPARHLRAQPTRAELRAAPEPGGAETGDELAPATPELPEQERIRAELARSAARLDDAERIAGVGSWELELGTGEITYSAGTARLLGLREGERVHVDDHLQHVHPADRRLVRRCRTDCIRDGSASCEYRITRPGGEVRTVTLRAEMVADAPDAARSMRGAVLDVTEQRRAERERLSAEALLRQGFDAAQIGMSLSEPSVRGRCLRVNDAMCALVGRPRDQLVGRSLLSAVAHPDDRSEVDAARRSLLSGNASSFRAEHRYFRADGSVAWGMLHITPVRGADGSVEALYTQLIDITESKEREARLERDVGEAIWLGRIRDALDADRLVLHAQPIVDLVTGETVQNELLLRMLGEDGELVAPGDFLPVAERYGLISEIDRWVIREAVASAAGGMPSEFNLSGRSIADPSTIRELATALQETGADPSLLVVEVTETAFAGHADGGREFARRVRALGCRLALDDFGTGFSTLSYLKHLPADYLKIDIEFVRELASSETDARVIRGIVGLAREFGQTTIAEGVEDETTLMLLRELGVQQAQGYLFGRPAPRGEPPARSGHGPRAGRPATSGSGQERAVRPAASQPIVGSAYGDDVAIVESAFAAFAAWDLPAMIAHCSPQIVLRPSPRFADGGALYRGHDGLRAYAADVLGEWDEWLLTAFNFRPAQGSVIVFGRSEGRRCDERRGLNVLWVVRVRDGLLESIEAFQAEH